MGKASRWLVNFLLGRKEEKGKRKNISISFEETPAASPTASPFKRRWSFGKLAIKEKVHKSFRSFDSRTATPLVKQAVSSLEQRQDSTRVLAMAMSSATKRKTTATKYTAAWITKAVEDAAATRIQAVFRSYLARKALHALRGLVKLQALVRGHLVRKQTTATLRRMHALMAIQVRARFQRIQMVEEPQLAVKSHSSRSGRFTLEMGFKRAEREAFDVNLYEKHGIVKSQNGFMNHSQIGTSEHGITTYYSGELSISKREQKYEEFSFTTHNSPRPFPVASSKPTPGRSSFSSHHEDPYMPNYMAKTESSKAKVESSRAKVRSQSEPKQRPKAKGKTISSAEEMNDYIQQKHSSSDEEMNDYNQQKHSSSQSKGIADENQEPWFANVYRSSRAANDEECYASGRTNYSEYRKSLVTNEPHATLF